MIATHSRVLPLPATAHPFLDTSPLTLTHASERISRSTPIALSPLRLPAHSSPLPALPGVMAAAFLPVAAVGARACGSLGQPLCRQLRPAAAVGVARRSRGVVTAAAAKATDDAEAAAEAVKTEKCVRRRNCFHWVGERTGGGVVWSAAVAWCAMRLGWCGAV